MTAQEVRTGREAKGMSRADLASAMGVSERTIYRWEAGEFQPRKAELVLLRSLLSGKVPTDQIIKHRRVS